MSGYAGFVLIMIAIIVVWGATSITNTVLAHQGTPARSCSTTGVKIPAPKFEGLKLINPKFEG
jgi:hypothetical protein